METRAKYNVPEAPQIEGDRLELLYVPLSWARDYFLDDNYKKHDVGVVSESMTEHGYRDPMAFDASANEGKGGIAYGNGRLETLCALYDQGYDCPRFVHEVRDGEQIEWWFQMQFGADSKDHQESVRFAITHNLSTFKGGDFSPVEILEKGFEPGIYDIIQGQLEESSEVIGMDGDDFQSVMESLQLDEQRTLVFDDYEEEDDSSGSQYQSNNGMYALAIALDKESAEDWESFKASVNLTDNKYAFLRLLAIANDYASNDGSQ